MKCIICNSEIESDDNFCHHCGHWTAKGYTYFNKNEDHLKLLEGNAIKSENKMIALFVLISLLIILFTAISIIRGNEILKPFVYIKKKIFNYKYGYPTSVIKTDNQYHKVNISNLEEANTYIKDDLSTQTWQCKDNIDIYHIEEELKQKYKIKSISFCDMNIEEVKKIKNTMDKVWTLFPNTIGYLDTISITNANTKNEYIAYFQPIYQFINTTEDIDKYNKVNKTQILLNSYYYLNNKVLSKNVNEIIKKDFYVKDVNWESLIAHEMGHYITFVSLLKLNNIDSITLVTKENENKIKELITVINSHTYAKEILEQALNNYNKYNHQNLSSEELISNISNYATTSPDETIAEAIHDYYLHTNNANSYSLEIIKILKERLGEKS